MSMTPHDEVDGMSQLYKVLQPFPPEARARMVRWALDRLKETERRERAEKADQQARQQQ